MSKLCSQPIRVEDPTKIYLITAKTINSKLWFVNNKDLEDRILGFLAKYVKKHEINIYAFILVGNHYHMIANFPKQNAAHFFQDFNARIAEAVRHYVPSFGEGPLFRSTYSAQVLLTENDIEKYFLYCALQCVTSGLCQKISDYPYYNSFSDAAKGKSKKYKLLRRGDYKSRKRYNSKIKKIDFIETHILKYSKLPYLESKSWKEISKYLHKRMNETRVLKIKERYESGKGFCGKERLLATKAGKKINNNKNGNRRPIVLSESRIEKSEYLDWYFTMVLAFKDCVEKLKKGIDTKFPPGTYKPPGLHIHTSPAVA